MMKPSAEEMGVLLYALCEHQSVWSQATFGPDDERGPVGALKHLEKEAKETQEAPTDIREYADCMLLILDASRRAGYSPWELVAACHEKMAVNEQREWPKPTPDEPVEHVR